MPFTHDTTVALVGAVALLNTAPERSGAGELLPDVAALDAFFSEWGWTGRHDRTVRELEDVRRLRTRLGRLWDLPEQELVEETNALLAQEKAVPQLVRHDEWDWHLHATTADSPLATRMAVEVAMALIDVVRAGELVRLSRCAGEDCRAALIDLSKNRSRRYCDGGCGNRANVAAYRARQSRESGEPDGLSH